MKMGSRLSGLASLAAWGALLVGVGGCSPRPEPGAGPAPDDPQALVAYGAEVYGYSCGRCHNARAAVERTDRAWEAVVDHMRVRANLTGGEARAVTAFMRALNLAPSERVVYDTVVVLDTLVRIDTVVVIDRALPPARAVPADTAAAEAAPRPRTPRPARQPARRATAEASPDSAAMVARGRGLVEARGCTGCHQIGGRGGAVGPKLDGVVGGRGVDYVRRKLRDPRFDNPSTVMPAFGFSDRELDAIIAYLRTLGG